LDADAVLDKLAATDVPVTSNFNIGARTLGNEMVLGTAVNVRPI
jgi:hypothetical protein